MSFDASQTDPLLQKPGQAGKSCTPLRWALGFFGCVVVVAVPILVVFALLRKDKVGSACDVLCTGPLQAAVLAVDPPLFNDSKTFVDLVLLKDPDEVLADFHKFEKMHPRPSASPSRSYMGTYREALSKFLVDHTSTTPASREWVPPDWTPEPPFLALLHFEKTRAWARKIHGLWSKLGKELDPDVAINPWRHTLISLKHPHMIVPGGRFLEFYYWDSYWIIRGLLVSSMVESAIMVAENLLDLVTRFGFMPNGSRHYYLDRSQPPLLSLIILDIVEFLLQRDQQSSFSSASDVVKASQLLADAIEPLRAEYEFFMRQDAHALIVTAPNGVQHTVNRYFSSRDTPRPESAREDAETAKLVPEEQRAMLYGNLAAGAESGWDFSSRWLDLDQSEERRQSRGATASERSTLDRFDSHSTNSLSGADLSTIRTMDILPVDLNAIMLRVERSLARLCQLSGNIILAEQFDVKAKARARALHDVFWDDATDMWRDVLLLEPSTIVFDSTGSRNPLRTPTPMKQLLLVTPANFVPLWAYTPDSLASEYSPNTGARVCDALQASGLIMPGGVSTSLTETGQQWDFPNAWAPLQWLLVQGTLPYNASLALKIKDIWLQSNFIAFNKSEAMPEKLNVTAPGALGSGGEYELQVGFGWSNGVVLDMLQQWPDSNLSGPDEAI